MKTHKNKTVSQSDLIAARNHVADWKFNHAQASSVQDKFASLVDEETKDYLLCEGLDCAEEIREGKRDHEFWVWQRLNTFLTGECVALLP